MKRILFLACTLIMVAGTCLHAQTPAVKKAAQSVFTLTTFDKSGNIVGMSHGVFTGSQGEALAMWTPFVGADSAVVTDSKGVTMAVDALLGVNDIYDICKFRVKGKTVPVAGMAGSAAKGSKAWIVAYSVKKPEMQHVAIQDTEAFMDSLTYYLFDDNDVSSTSLGCPIVNDQGQLLGIMQRPKNGGRAFSTDARLSATLRLSALSINDNTLRKCGIRTALPSKSSDAVVTLMLASQRGDSALYARYIDEFITTFPTLPDGYNAKGEQEMVAGNYANAARNMETAIKVAENKDEAHYNYANLIYRKEVYVPEPKYKDWSLDKALQEAEAAYAINSLPVYKHLQGKIIYAKGDYQQAYDTFMSLTSTNLRGGELFYEAAQCRRQLNAPTEEIIQLLDSAVSAQPNDATAAPYILERGMAYDKAGKQRKAFIDYCAYDSLMRGRASHSFYYMKFQCENKIRLYQQALNDIAHAIVLNRTEPTYYAEMASLQLKVGQYEQAIKTTDLALQLTDKYSDLYIIRGVCFGEMSKTEEALQALQKAKDLGDERADELISKYQK